MSTDHKFDDQEELVRRFKKIWQDREIRVQKKARYNLFLKKLLYLRNEELAKYIETRGRK